MTKMVLFALIINSVGSVNSVPQVGGVGVAARARGHASLLPCCCRRRWSAARPCGATALVPALPPPPPGSPGRPPPQAPDRRSRAPGCTPPPLPLQILALVLVALAHLLYLRICLPFRMRIELAAEMVASLCDLAVFVCGIILIAKPAWTADQRQNMGIAMLVIQVRVGREGAGAALVCGAVPAGLRCSPLPPSRATQPLPPRLSSPTRLPARPPPLRRPPASSSSSLCACCWRCAPWC